jgi:hypothetical protein
METLRFADALDLQLKSAIVFLEDRYARFQHSKSLRVWLDGTPFPKPKPRPDKTVRRCRTDDYRYRRSVEDVFH